MKWPRNFVIRATAVCMTLALMGCRSDSTSPDSARPNSPTPPAPVPSFLFPMSVLSQFGWAGFGAIDAPRIEVLDQNRHRMANVSVNFSVTRGGGSVLTASVKTDDYGFAFTPWILGKQGGPNTVVASVGTMDSVSFQADATVPVIVASYDLVGVDSTPLPFHFANDPTSITGGHILIAADNEFAFGFDFNGVSNLRPTGIVVRVDATTVNFYWRQPDEDGISGVWATGRIEGNTMLFTIDESIGFKVLKYVLKN
jgi:hypothetical protein